MNLRLQTLALIKLKHRMLEVAESNRSSDNFAFSEKGPVMNLNNFFKTVLLLWFQNKDQAYNRSQIIAAVSVTDIQRKGAGSRR